MRLTDLLGRRVVDEAGEDVGQVLDVRLVQAGPVIGAFGASFRVEGLVVGPRMSGTRLGYGRRGMTGPKLLAWPLQRRHRRVRFVPWARVGEMGAETIRIAGSRADLAEPGPLGP